MTASVGTNACRSLAPQSRPARPLTPADVHGAVGSDRELAFRLFPAVAAGRTNVVVSPASLRMALTMSWAGARGETAAQLHRLLGLRGEPEAVHAAWKVVSNRWAGTTKAAKDADLSLHMANGFFAAVDIQFAREYFELIATHYAAPVVPLDFQGSGEANRARINGWVEKRTDGRIADVMPSGSVDIATRLLLVNAATFGGKWRHPMDPARAVPGDFRVSDKTKVKPKMMGFAGPVAYAETAEAQVVELPYADGSIVLDVVLPRGDLSVVETQLLDPKKLDQLLAALSPRQVDLTLPQFAAQSRLELKDALKKLGIGDAFEKGKADFSGMDGTHLLFIDQIVHQSSVQVTDQVSDTAAAPAPPSSDAPAASMRVDHPFLYVIRDRKLDAILFLGRVLDPTQS